MNYQTSQLWRIPYSKVLLMQASEAHWEPSQAFKMGILAKVVNGLKLFLKLWAVIGGLYEGALDTWISDTNNPTDPKTKKSQFVLNHLITWIMTLRIYGNNRIASITQITLITCFPFISCVDQFCLYFPKSNVNGIPA